jgi:competence ComEA-like helix-hairpin-helix protein
LVSKPEEELEAVSPFKEEPSEWVPEEEGEEARFEAPLTEVEADSDQELPTWLRDLDQEEEVEEGVEERVETTPSWLRPEPEVEGEEIPEVLTTKLDINTASLIQLERISGIGFILAQNIVNYRETQKTFESLSELEKVPGFSPDSVQELEGYLTVEVVTEAPPPPSTLPELQAAWDKVSTGDIPMAVEEYSALIRQEQHLEDIIRDLQEAVALHPIDAALYQTLGDAYVRTNRLQEALDAYNRAEDLLH